MDYGGLRVQYRDAEEFAHVCGPTWFLRASSAYANCTVSTNPISLFSNILYCILNIIIIYT